MADGCCTKRRESISLSIDYAVLGEYLMKRITVVIFLLVIGTTASAQSQDRANFLLKRFESRISFDYLQEFSTAVVRYVEKNRSRETTKVAIRYCSNEPLETAKKKSVIGLKAIYSVFKGYGFEGEDLMLLRSSKCHWTKSIVPLEIWIINDPEKLPSYRERYVSYDEETQKMGYKWNGVWPAILRFSTND